jgi:hypothetical protein
MTSRILGMAVAVVLATVPMSVHAQTSFSVSGGLNAPVNDLGDIADIGYNVAAALNVGAPSLPVGLRFEGAYNGLGLKDGTGDVRIISVTANAIFNLGKTSDAPYLIAGLGAYNRQLNFDQLGSTGDRTVVGINGGGGLRFPLSGISTFVEARYHIMLGNSDDATNYQFIPITFGIVF